MVYFANAKKFNLPDDDSKILRIAHFDHYNQINGFSNLDLRSVDSDSVVPKYSNKSTYYFASGADKNKRNLKIEYNSYSEYLKFTQKPQVWYVDLSQFNVDGIKKINIEKLRDQTYIAYK